MSGKEDVQKLGRLLQKYHLQNCKVLAGFQLSYPQEKVLALTPKHVNMWKKPDYIYVSS